MKVLHTFTRWMYRGQRPNWIAPAYIVATGGERDAHDFIPEESRRARALPVYAALRSAGRRGFADLIERNCRQASRFAEALRAAGFEVLNEVHLNQVLVSLGTPEQTQRTIAALSKTAHARAPLVAAAAVALVQPVTVDAVADPVLTPERPLKKLT